MQAAQLRRRGPNLVKLAATEIGAAAEAGMTPPLQMRVSLLEQNMGAFGKAMGENAQALHVAFGMTDAHIAVHYRVLNDMQKETQVCVVTDTEGNSKPMRMGDVYRTSVGDIDMERYHDEHAGVLAAAEFLKMLDAAAVAARPTPDQPEAPDASLLTALPDFGGEHAPPA